MYRNSEYYPDPTAGIALARIAREERLARKRLKPPLQPRPVSRRKKHVESTTAASWHLAWSENADHPIKGRR